MTESPEPLGPPSQNIEALVTRAVSEQIDPLRAQVSAMGRAVAIVAGRLAGPQQLAELSSRLDGLRARLDDVAPRETSLASLERTVQDELATRLDALTERIDRSTAPLSILPTLLEAIPLAMARALDEAQAPDRRAQVEEIGTAVSRAVDQALAQAGPGQDDLARLAERVEALEAAVRGEADARRAQTDDLRQALSVAVTHAVAKVDQARGLDAERILERMVALGSPAQPDPDDRRALVDDLRAAVTSAVAPALAAAVDQAVARVEATQGAERDRILDRMASIEAAVDAGQAQASGLRDAVAGRIDEWLTTVEGARTADVERLERSIAEIEAARAADAARLSEELAALHAPLAQDAAARRAELDGMRDTLAAAVERIVGQVEAARAGGAAELVDQVTALAGRVEAEAQRREAQAAALLTTIDERLQSLHLAGVDAGQEQERRLSDRVATATAEQVRLVLDRIDERTAPLVALESVPALVAAEVQAATARALADQIGPLVAKLVEAGDGLAHEGGRIEALARAHAGEARAVEERLAAMLADVVERAEAAIDRSRARVNEGQVALHARFDAVMAELQSSVNASAERLEACVTEGVDVVRALSGHQNAALLDTVNRTSQQVRESLAALRAAVEDDGHDPRIDALVLEQVASREAQLAAIEAVSARIGEIGPMVAHALLSEVERAVRAANATEEAVAGLRVAVEGGPDDGSAARLELLEQSLDDLRASQAALREVVETGTHKAELTAIDVRGLRERLAPHLVALTEATTRRADADQAGFDAVLARLDQLLAARLR